MLYERGEITEAQRDDFLKDVKVSALPIRVKSKSVKQKPHKPKRGKP